MFKGVDVSKWQGKIDWERVKKAGIQFAIIRAGYGQNNIDEQFKRNISECNRLSIPAGVYWFSYAYTPVMAKQEAQYCLNAIKPYRIEYPVVFDFEYDSVNYAKKKGVTITKALATDIAEAFLKTIEESGYYPMIYTNRDYMVNMFDMNRLKKYDIWYARYTSKLDKQDVAIWQYTSSGKVDGISGNVDMNISYKDYPSIISNLGLNGFTKETVSRGGGSVTVLKKGMRGEDVKILQENLNKLGFSCGTPDGIFGVKTESAVKAFQQRYGLVVDGIAGSATLAKIQELLNASSNQSNVQALQERIKQLEATVNQYKNMLDNIKKIVGEIK